MCVQRTDAMLSSGHAASCRADLLQLRPLTTKIPADSGSKDASPTVRPDLRCCSPPGRYGPAGRGSPRKPRAARLGQTTCARRGDMPTWEPHRLKLNTLLQKACSWQRLRPATDAAPRRQPQTWGAWIEEQARWQRTIAFRLWQTPIRFLISCANRMLTSAGPPLLMSLRAYPRAASPTGPQAPQGCKPGACNLPYRPRQPRTHKRRTLPKAPPLPTNLLRRRDHGRASREVLDSARDLLVTCINPKPGPRPGTTRQRRRCLAHRNTPAQHTASQPSRPRKEARHRSYVQHEYSARVTSGRRNPTGHGGRI